MALELNYKILGEGKVPVVIMHGLFGMLDNWLSFGKKAAENRQVILVDHRNHGRSPHDPKVSYALYAEDLYKLLTKLELEKVHLLGHSMGGKTAMAFALAYPNKTASMTSVDMGAHGYLSGNHDAIFDAILPLDLSTFTRRNEIDQALVGSIPDFGIRQFLLKNLSRSEQGFSWKANFPSLHKEYDSLRQAIESKTTFDGKALFVRGGNSNYVRDTDMDYILQLFPNAELVTIPDAGHWVHADKPDELLNLLMSTLE